MKRTIALILTVIMVSLVFAGCNSSTSEYSNPYAELSLETISAVLENADSFKTLEISKTEADKELQSSIDSLLEAWLDTLAEGTEIIDGDQLVIDFSGILENEETAFDGGTATDASLEIGSDSFIDGFEDGLIGHKIGEKDIVLNLTFPDDYVDASEDADKAAQFNGKAVKFTVTVKSGKRSAEYNDELIKKAFADNADAIYKYSTVDEFEERTLRQVYANLAFEAYKKTVKMTSFPYDLVKENYDATMQQYTTSAKSYGMTLEEFVSSIYFYYYTGSTYTSLESFAESVQSSAASTVKNQYLVYYVYQSNKAAIDALYNDEKSYNDVITLFKADYAEYAAAYSLDESFEEAYSDEQQLKDMVIKQLTYEYIASFVTVIDDVVTPTPTPTTTATPTPTPTETSASTATPTSTAA